jgi:adenylate cyclase
MRFNYDEEDALVALAAQLGTAIHALQQASESYEGSPAPVSGGVEIAGKTATVRHYKADDSIFIDDDYLIKGVAGAIFFKLLRDYRRDKRTEFTNKELRLDSSLGLPDITDNLEARLILLQRRLSERRSPQRIQKTGRGRFRLEVSCPFTLVEM